MTRVRRLARPCKDFLSYFGCLESLSCWKVHLLPRFTFLADEIRFSSKLSWYIAPFIVLSMTYNDPVSFAEKELPIMMLPSPYFTVVMMFLDHTHNPSFPKHNKLNSYKTVLFLFPLTRMDCSKRVLVCLDPFRCTSLCFIFSRGLLCEV